MPYLLDANVLIEAKNRYYGLDFCPAFWDWLLQANGAASVFSIEKVGDELGAGEDELAAWAEVRGSGLFLKPTAEMAKSLVIVSEWAQSQQYEAVAISRFLEGADYYLVAHAHAHAYAVVTHERHSTSTKIIKIPDACLGVGVKSMNTFEMLRYERARFVLPPATGPGVPPRVNA
ncbi:MAG: DUF4411 family protein [Planctomycetota bacterium]